MGLKELAEIATIIGVPLAVIALIYTGIQLKRSVAISRGQFMLELEKMVALHDSVHIRLRPGGEWASSNSGPKDAEEWAELEDYMGFFEHCELLLRAGSLRLKGFRALFEYRVYNIMANSQIVNAKLITEGKSWTLFLELLDRLNIPRPATV